ncbi:hypothetical protein RAE21_01380 [Rhodoferax sp. TBRC 17198]|uniref:hypothetical protein n=1 Tax=Rhodoferax potami TaxID=3068338 RepID=UPI0028BE28F2|nr:hypothetical protein [Rhodoferax sp. TBRC 17198]MDT7521070.1 hypothetical protein [Rhodoferax sp. TBRC 17198]
MGFARNTLIVVSTFFFAISLIRLSDKFIEPLLAALLGVCISFIFESLATKFLILRKYSPKTLLHEGAHYFAAKAFRLKPEFILGAPYVKLGVMPVTKYQQSLVSLAPILVWWLGLLFAIGMNFANYPYQLIGIAMLWPLTDIGCPSNYPSEGSDWDLACRYGSSCLNHVLIGFGIAIQMLGAFYIASRCG